jgi:hypothetical protein
VFGLLFLFNLLIDTKTVVRYLGRETGRTGYLIAVVTGIISAGPIYLWYPLLSDLKEKRDARSSDRNFFVQPCGEDSSASDDDLLLRF